MWHWPKHASHSSSYPIIKIFLRWRKTVFSFLVRWESQLFQQNLWEKSTTSDCKCLRLIDPMVLNVLFQLAAQQRYSDYMRSIWDQIKAIDQSTIFDEKLYRQVKLLASIGPSALPADQLDRVGFWHVMRFYNCVIDWRWIVWLKYNRIINDMLAIYNSATICGYEQPFHCSLRLQPQLREVR